MSKDIPSSTPEKRETLEDNARKFTTVDIDDRFLENQAATSFKLIVDWLEVGDDKETKLAYKQFADGEVQILLISKVTKDGKRTSQKSAISLEKYQELVGSSMLHDEKLRHQFQYRQGEVTFSMNYDEHLDGKRMLEVDASSDEIRGLFQPDEFPYSLTEVTGDLTYYGYHLATA